MRCISTEQLNIAAEDPEKIISDGERYYFEQLSMAEEKIYASHEKRPVVLISGPSGSGKTTSAHRIADLLAKRGCKAHIISMDNYFLSMSENEAARDKNGNIDSTFDHAAIQDVEAYFTHICGNDLVLSSAGYVKTEGHQIYDTSGRILAIQDFKDLYPDLV